MHNKLPHKNKNLFFTLDSQEVSYLSEVCESELIPRGTVVVTFSVDLTTAGDSSMVLIHSWSSGTATAYIYHKKNPVFINLPSPREKAQKARQHSSITQSSNKNNQGKKGENSKRKEPRAFFPDTESDDEQSRTEEDETDARQHPVFDLPARPKTSRGRQDQQEDTGATNRPKTSRGPEYRRGA